MRFPPSYSSHFRTSPETAPFWEACAEEQLRLPTCGECHKAHLPPGPVCPFCFSDLIRWELASGLGRVSSWVTYHKAFSQPFEPLLPYNAALIELDEGPRLTSTIDGDEIQVGMRVEVRFERVSDTLRVPVFVMAGEGV